MIHGRNWWKGIKSRSGQTWLLGRSATHQGTGTRQQPRPAYLESAAPASRDRGHLGTGRKGVSQRRRGEEVVGGRRQKQGEGRGGRGMGGTRQQVPRTELDRRAQGEGGAQRERKAHPTWQATAAPMSPR